MLADAGIMHYVRHVPVTIFSKVNRNYSVKL